MDHANLSSASGERQVDATFKNILTDNVDISANTGLGLNIRNELLQPFVTGGPNSATLMPEVWARNAAAAAGSVDAVANSLTDVRLVNFIVSPP